MTIDHLVGAVIGAVAASLVFWLIIRGRSLIRVSPLDRGHVSTRILNQLSKELEQKGIAKVDRDFTGQVRQVHWSGEGGVGISGEGSLTFQRPSSREPDADQGPQC
jgi:hypothetical protein